MKIVALKAAASASPYLELVRENYKGYSQSFLTTIENQFQKAFSKSGTESILVMDDKKILAHAILDQNPGMGQGIGSFGFFECINDKQVCSLLFEKIFQRAREINLSKILGPINLDTWHTYRVISEGDQSPLFWGEPLCLSYYSELIDSQNPSNTINYYSAYREKYDNMIEATEQSYLQALNNGISIKAQVAIAPEQHRQIWQISSEIFSKNWAYSPINYEEFSELYPILNTDNKSQLIYTASLKEEVIGFCSVIISGNNQRIVKTLALKKKFHGMGLGNALVHCIHKDAKKGACAKIIYALIRNTNQIKNFPTENGIVMRKYKAYEFEI